MKNLLQWILFPGAIVVLRFGDDTGGGNSGQEQEKEEQRKKELREKIDVLFGARKDRTYYGVNTVGGPGSWENYETNPAWKWFDNPDEAADAQREVDARARGAGGKDSWDEWSDTWKHAHTPPDSAGKAYAESDADHPSGMGTGLMARIVRPDPDAPDIEGRMAKESTDLAGANRGYYADQLAREYAKAERNARFEAARRSVLGGSSDIDTQAELRSDRDLGATRVDEAVRRSVLGLDSSREQERMNALNLVQAGYGDSAVTAAQRGISATLDASRSASKESLFSDLFSAGSLGAGAYADNARQQALLQQYRDQVRNFTNAQGGKSGRVTGTE